MEGVFRQSGVVRSFKVVDPVLFVFGSYILYSRDFQFFPYDFASYFIQPCVPRVSTIIIVIFFTKMRKILQVLVKIFIVL